MESECLALVAGDAAGTVIRLDVPLSFWGGVDPSSGTIIDQRHPQLGEDLTGRILVMAHSRGSSSSSGVLAECIRAGTAPRAIIMNEPDIIVMLGALVADELYGTTCPVIVTDDVTFAALATGDTVSVLDGGTTLRQSDP
ncbi:MAG: DUF126 domain-containing protein [Acidimicrobiia bacterium]|nr:MAG: DUF126 domain-containing protein [Acidimicrobiia bacterium]